jgi:hypothetical protein
VFFREGSISLPKDNGITLKDLNKVAVSAIGLGAVQEHYPLEKIQIVFKENGTYTLDSVLLFSPPLFDEKMLHHVFNTSKELMKRLGGQGTISEAETHGINQLPETLLLCFFNGFLEAKDLLDQAKPLLKGLYPNAYNTLKESQRILRKVKYN